jgi:endonuclease/exonuclease/phosphatase family metal-dependent hydrolase
MRYLIIVFILNLSLLEIFPSDLKILWWNVNNFFDIYDDPDTDDTVLKEDFYLRKLNILSEKIKYINADVVGLAEIENESVLKDLADKSGYKYYYIKNGNDPRGINIAFLSKYKADYISHKDQKTPYKGNIEYKFSRDCPEAIIVINNTKIYFLLNHLKSRSDDNSSDLENSSIKRIAQVNGIMEIVSEIYTNNQIKPYIIITGDFNDIRYSKPINIIEKSGFNIINYLYDEKKYFTYSYKNKKEDSDYIIINNDFYKKIKIRKYKSYNTNDYYSISDHFPLFLEIEFQ